MKTNYGYVGQLFCLWLVFGVSIAEGSNGGVVTCDFQVKGTAAGGAVVLTELLNRNQRFISVDTSAGESGEMIAARLVNALNEKDPFGWNKLRKSEDYFVVAKGDTICGLPGPCAWYILAGTDAGFGRTAAPLDLSCAVDKGEKRVLISWRNPGDKYDSIIVRCFWPDFDHKVQRSLQGDATEFVIDTNAVTVDINDFDVRVHGLRGEMLSNAGAIHVEGVLQAEVYGIPFSDNLAPNWSAWSYGKAVDKGYFGQGDKYVDLLQPYNPARGLLTKPFYQIIKAPGKEGIVHGVFRRFMRLKGGHTYQVTACLNTLSMDSIEADWSVSLCATDNGSADTVLSSEQLAGVEPLHGGSEGLEGAKIASYGPVKTTHGNFEIVATDNENSITLPADASSMTIWVVFRCSNPEGAVGLSGVSIEDVTEKGGLRKTERIRQEELQKEEELIEREMNAYQRLEKQ